MKLNKKFLAPIFTALAAASLVGGCSHPYNNVEVTCIDGYGQETAHKTFHNINVTVTDTHFSIGKGNLDGSDEKFSKDSCRFKFSP
jgi:hypothetical protein